MEFVKRIYTFYVEFVRNPLPSIPSPQRGEGKQTPDFPLSIRQGVGTNEDKGVWLCAPTKSILPAENQETVGVGLALPGGRRKHRPYEENPARWAYGNTPLRAALIVLAAVVLALILFSGATPANAQGSGGEDLPPGVTWDQVNGIAHQMYCDVCEGIPLDECESVACRNWRQEIARLLGEGYTEDEIINHFVARYGEEVAALPRDKTDRWLAYIVPMVLVGAVGVIGFFQVRRFRQRGQQAGQVVRRSGNLSTVRPVPDDVDPAVLARLQQELENLEL